VKCGLRIVLILMTMCLAIGAHAKTWHVEQDGAGDFTDIQPAVDAAAVGDTIRIGPGRFDMFHPITAPGWTEDTIVGVLKDNLTFVGSGKDVTFLGPETFYGPYGTHPKVFCSFGGFDAVIMDMTIENAKDGIYWAGGTLGVKSCLFRGRDPNFFAVYLFVDNGTVSDCEFDLVGGGGSAIGILNSQGNVQGLEVSNCNIEGAQFGVRVGYGAPNIQIRDCALDVTWWGIAFDGASTGTVRNCRIRGAQDSSVFALNGSLLEIFDSEMEGGLRGISAVGGSVITGTGIVVANTTEAALAFSSAAQISIHQSHILPASGAAVYCYPFSWSPITIDLTGNYWGTTDAEAIAGSIHDAHDDPAVPYTVVYAPYANGPVPAEATTWGNLKALWR
jgi:hypothetical protein